MTTTLAAPVCGGPYLPGGLAAAAADREADFGLALNPRNSYQRWLVADTARLTVRLDGLMRKIDVHERNRSLRARDLWDHDRKIAAELLGARLHRNPARVAA